MKVGIGGFLFVSILRESWEEHVYMCSAATVNRYKPAGRPGHFLLQLVSNLTSNFDRFLLF